MGNEERKGYILSPENKRINTSPLSFGFSASNLANLQNSEFILPNDLEALINLASSQGAGIELQLEPEEGRMKLPDTTVDTSNLPFLGVHLPIIGVDMTRDNPQGHDSNFLLFDKTIKMAADLNATYIVSHLQGNLNWDNLNQRGDLINRMKNRANNLAELIKTHNYKGKLLFENLEFPLFPANNAEIEDFMKWVTNFGEKHDIQTGLCLDLAHLWHSGLLLSENKWRPETKPLLDPFNQSEIEFPEYLETLLENIGDNLETVHVTGTKISPHKHDTHLLPALSGPQVATDRVTLDIASSLKEIYRSASLNNKNISVVNEAHNFSYQDMSHANRSIENFLNFCYPEKITSPEHLDNPRDYYFDPRVVNSILAYLGADGNQWEDASGIKHAYVGIGYEEKMRRGGKSPLSTVAPKYIGHMIDIEQGQVELHASLLASSENNRPSRIMLAWDLDRYRLLPDNQGGHNYDQATPILTSNDTFKALEPVINLYLHAFDLLHIPVMTTLSGKGVHFITQITDSETIDKIADIGGPVEESMLGKLADASRITKAKAAIPEIFQKAHIGAGRLQQMLNMYLIKESRNLLNPYFDAEIFNKGYPGREVNGIAFDNAAIMFPVYLKTLSTLGSLYFIKGIKSGLQFPDMSIQIPISGNGYRYNWSDVIHNRSDLSSAASYLDSVDCHIPNANKLDRLLSLYNLSDIRNLHQAMDSSMGDDPRSFNDTYRKDNYRIVNSTAEPEINKRTVKYASAFLGGRGLQFHYFDKLIFQLYQAMGERLDVAPHVAGFLRALYEDPNKDWGYTWTGKMDATTYARKITEQFLGQMFESNPEDFWEKIKIIA